MKKQKKLTHEERSAIMKAAWAKKKNGQQISELPKLVTMKQKIRKKILQLIDAVDYDNETLADTIINYFEKGEIEFKR